MDFLQAAGIAFVATAIAIYFLRPVSARLGLVDHPDAVRKHHAESTSLCGGLGIVLGFVAALPLLGGALEGIGWSFLVALLPLLAVGLWDDITEIHWWARMAAQILSALLMVYWGQVVIVHVGDLVEPGRMWTLGIWAVPLTVFSVVGMVNAINMLDGLDGLAGGVVWMALGWFAAAALIQGAGAEAMFVVALMGALAGFLVFNLRYPVNGKALVFLGDAGSTVLGFALGWLSIRLSQMQPNGLPPMSVIWILGLPLFDAVTQIVRRLAEGRSPMSPDRNHLHHMLLRSGLSAGQSVAVMLLVAWLFGAIGVGAWQQGVPTYFMFWGFLALYGVYLVAVTRAGA